MLWKEDVFADTFGIMLMDLHIPYITVTASNAADIREQYLPQGSRSAQKISPGYMTSPVYIWVAIYADIHSVQNVVAQLRIIGLPMTTYG